AALPPLARRLPRREGHALALALGVAFVLQNLLLLGASATYRVISGGTRPQTITFGPVTLSRVTLVAAGAAVAALVGLDLWLHVSWIGSGLRAVSQSRPAAASLGISPARMEWVAFLAGGAIAAGAGGPERAPSWRRESRLESSSLSRRCSWEAPGVRSWRAVAFSFGFSSPGRRC